MKLEEIRSIIGSKFAGNIIITESNVGEITIDVAKNVLVGFCKFLKSDSKLRII